MENKKRLTDVNPIIRNLTAMKSMYDAIALDGMIKALEEAPAVDAADFLREQWISVDARMPEGFRPVIVCREKVKGEYVVEQGYKDVGDWWKVYGTRTKKVTHWMPLPDPPEEDK